MPTTEPHVFCVGETMVLFVPEGDILTSATFHAEMAGAESTVAMYLADYGCHASWCSRLGQDPLGDRILAAVAARNVGTDLVSRDPARPTGLFLKAPGPEGTTVHYYRSGSAASALSPEDAARLPLDASSLVHTSGITQALSRSCAAAVAALREQTRAAGAAFSFDVNHRPGLWSAQDAAEPLLATARESDIVFVGRDEAERLWGTERPAEIAALFSPQVLLVVKDAEAGASACHDGRSVFVPTPPVDVVEPVGAGDAFAAGFLAAHLRGAGLQAALGLGHATAAWTLGSVMDYRPLPDHLRTRLEQL